MDSEGLMSFWTRMAGVAGINTGVIANELGDPDYNPGDPDGLEIQKLPVGENRGLPIPMPSSWDGLPENWGTAWQVNQGINKLVDIAWACLDLNSNIVSSMPVYQLRGSQIIPPEQWMLNPDPETYTSWEEFAKQLFWDFQMGEAFVLPMATGYDGYPSRFRVIPPWMMKVDIKKGRRVYQLGTIDCTEEILHIRYKSTIENPRGQGPLEVAGARQTMIRLLQRYVENVVQTGGVPQYWIGVDRKLQKGEAADLLETWIETRSKNVGQPAILGSNATLNQAKSMSAHDMALTELTQMSESRIAVLLGVPPFLVGLAGAAAGASGSLTYSNVTDLFDFHDRSSLRPKSKTVMSAISQKFLPSTRTAELNRDDYTRLPFDKRMAAYAIAIENGILTAEEIRIMERYYGETNSSAPLGLTGGNE
jgi:HK97 family phage portal protein